MFDSILDSVRGLIGRRGDDEASAAPRSSSVQRVMRRPAKANGHHKPINGAQKTNGAAAGHNGAANGQATANGNGTHNGLSGDSQQNGASRSDAGEDVRVPSRIVSRGNNKNVYVVAVPGIDDNDVLREADALEIDTSSLETVEEEGFDPYNSGRFNRDKTWRR